MAIWFDIFVALTFKPHKIQVSRTLLWFNIGIFSSSSTVSPLANARSLVVLTVLNLTVNEYQFFSGMKTDKNIIL